MDQTLAQPSSPGLGPPPAPSPRYADGHAAAALDHELHRLDPKGGRQIAHIGWDGTAGGGRNDGGVRDLHNVTVPAYGANLGRPGMRGRAYAAAVLPNRMEWQVMQDRSVSDSPLNDERAPCECHSGDSRKHELRGRPGQLPTGVPLAALPDHVSKNLVTHWV